MLWLFLRLQPKCKSMQGDLKLLRTRYRLNCPVWRFRAKATHVYTFFFPGNASPSTFILVLCISYLDLKVFEYHVLSFSSLLLNCAQLPTSARLICSTESVGPAWVILLDGFLLSSPFFLFFVCCNLHSGQFISLNQN